MSLLGRLHGWISVGVLGLIYFGVLTPVAVVLRLLGRDALRLRRGDADSYWIPSGPPPAPERLERPY